MIVDFKNGANVSNFKALVKDINVGMTKKGDPFAGITLADKSGDMPAKIWAYQPLAQNIIEPGMIILIQSGNVSEFNGSLQLTIGDYVLCPDEDMADYAKSSRFDIEKMWSELVFIVDEFQEPLTKYVAENLLMKHAEVMEAVKSAPAAKGVHNAWYGGLLEHICSMIKLGKFIVEHYEVYGINISRDKVLFGCALHDLGKIAEYNYKTPAFDLSKLGVLTNHIVLGPAWIWEAANKYDKKNEIDFKIERAQLMHLVASHHGQLDWGSPVKPSTIEAVLLHQIDMIDSKVMTTIEAIEGPYGKIEDFSEKVWTAGTQFYKGPKV